MEWSTIIIPSLILLFPFGLSIYKKDLFPLFFIIIFLVLATGVYTILDIITTSLKKTHGTTNKK